MILLAEVVSTGRLQHETGSQGVILTMSGAPREVWAFSRNQSLPGLFRFRQGKNGRISAFNVAAASRQTFLHK